MKLRKVLPVNWPKIIGRFSKTGIKNKEKNVKKLNTFIFSHFAIIVVE